jgi:Transglycosylase SLT domain
MPFQTMGPESPFAKYAGVVPENFLRILAFKESGFRPEVVHPKSHATGLFQITSTISATTPRSRWRSSWILT